MKSFLEDDPKDTFVLFALAKEYEKLNVLKMAIETYEKLKQVDPDYVGLYYHLANAYVLVSDKENAAKTYEDGIEVAKKLADFHALSELHNAKTNFELEL